MTLNDLHKSPQINLRMLLSDHIIPTSDNILWHGGVISRASYMRFTGRRFESCLSTIVQWP